MKHVQILMLIGLFIVAHIHAFAQKEYAWAINFNLADADCSTITKCHECAVSNCHWSASPTTKNKAAGSCKKGVFSDGKNGTMQVGTFFENAAKCEDTEHVCNF